MPNTRGRFKRNLSSYGDDFVGRTIDSGLPNITGYVSGVKVDRYTTTTSGALWYSATSGGKTDSGGSDAGRRISIDASRSNSIFGAQTYVCPPTIIIPDIIKY